MRLHAIWTIFRKEITEALRDRLTLIVMLGLPILIYPLVVTLLTRIQRTHEAAEDKRVSQVAVWGTADQLTDFLSRTNTLNLESWKAIPEEMRRAFESGEIKAIVSTNSGETEAATRKKRSGVAASESKDEVLLAARAILDQKTVDAVLVLWPGTTEAIERLDLGRVTVFYDPVRPASDKAWDRLNEQLADFRRQLVESRQTKLNLPAGFAKALEIRQKSVATPAKVFGDSLGRLLPLLLIMLSATGALYAAVDVVAGEKDRATMQTLLCAPVLPLEIVAGKFLTVWSISLVSACANVVSLGFTFTRVAASANLPAIPIVALGGVLGALMLLTCTVAAAFVGVAALARDAKDAGNFLSAALTLLVVPVAASIMPGVELNAWTAFVPLVNLSLLIKSFFLQELSLNLFFLSVVAAFAYALLALLFASRVFGREEILLGGSGMVRHLLPGQRRATTQPTVGLVLGLFAVVLVTAFYGSLLLEGRSMLVSILTVQYGVFLLPVIVVTMVMRFPVAETFRLRRPDWRSVLGSVLIGVAGGTAAAGLTLRLLPPPDSLVEGLREALLLGNEPVPLPLVLLVLAFTPAFCEELFFRGLTLSGLRRLKPWLAIGLSALLFGVAHASIYRLLPTLLLGAALGYVAWRSGSIYCSMIVHAVNNGLIATLVHTNATFWGVSISEVQFVPWTITAAAMAVMSVGLLLIRAPKSLPHSAGAFQRQSGG
jgi:sodium transport system permease protein